MGDRTWTYRTSFTATRPEKHDHVDLVFDGLDTFAEVRLNGVLILESDNMFLQYRVNVTDMLLTDQANVLDIRFASALHRGRELEKQHSEHRFLAYNGETGRLAVRKAQYHWVSAAFLDIYLRIRLNHKGMGLGPGNHDRRSMETSATRNVSCPN